MVGPVLVSGFKSLPLSSLLVPGDDSWSLAPWIGLALVSVVIALVAWGLQLMQSAIDQQEFSLMLAGCLVCSAAVGLATVMVMTLNNFLL